MGIVCPHLPTRCVRDILIPMSLDISKDTNFRFRFAFKIELIIYPTRKICLTFLLTTCTSMPYCIVLTLRFMTMECPPSRTGDSVLGQKNNPDTYGKHVRFLRMSKFTTV